MLITNHQNHTFSSTSTFEQFNVTHTINKIRFGEEFPGSKNQLDGETRVISDGYGMYQYYFKVSFNSYERTVYLG